MKIKYIIPAVFALMIGISSCDKNFEEINTSPTQATTLDPMYQLANAQHSSAVSDYHYQGAIVQNIITPYGGVLEGGNRNTYIDANASALFVDFYTGPIKNLIDITEKLKNNAERTNLYNMSRIWKAYCFQRLVDTYGDIPYSDAGKAFISNTFLPKYDDQEVIYEDIIKEYTEATDALDANLDKVTGEIWYKGDIAKWKKLGNSLLLRAGMRYTKYNSSTAATIVATATDPARGGVFDSNTDNVSLQYTAAFTYGTGSILNGGERHNYYVGAPFVDFLKLTNDPRAAYMICKYPTPANPLATAGTPNITLADQQGMPYGYDETTLINAPGFPGKIGSAYAYSQFNRATVAAVEGKQYLITWSQTLLLLAEARQRGYISTGTVQEYYESALRANMAQQSYIVITAAQQDAFIAGAEVAFDAARALEQINEQYWVSSFMIWGEAWSNFRRSGYPQLSPINYAGEDPAVNQNNSGGFIQKLPYPNREKSVNPASVEEATTRMGGDNLGIRVFWDTI